jgi:hypothetical protein
MPLAPTRRRFLYLALGMSGGGLLADCRTRHGRAQADLGACTNCRHAGRPGVRAGCAPAPALPQRVAEAGLNLGLTRSCLTTASTLESHQVGHW